MSLVTTAAKLACHDIYDPITPDVFQNMWSVDESVWGLTRIDGVTYIVAQGTELLEDGKPSLAGWEADFDALPVTVPMLGTLHEGFNRNTEALVALVMQEVKPTEYIVFCGHSKGAAEAPIGAARLFIAGYTNIRCILFAPPNPGEQQFSNWMRSNIPGRGFRNCSSIVEGFGDPIPLLPPWGYPCYPHEARHAPPKGLQEVSMVCWHAGALYIEATLLD